MYREELRREIDRARLAEAAARAERWEHARRVMLAIGVVAASVGLAGCFGYQPPYNMDRPVYGDPS